MEELTPDQPFVDVDAPEHVEQNLSLAEVLPAFVALALVLLLVPLDQVLQGALRPLHLQLHLVVRLVGFEVEVVHPDEIGR